jgi:hypothetical protein
MRCERFHHLNNRSIAYAQAGDPGLLPLIARPNFVFPMKKPSFDKNVHERGGLWVPPVDKPAAAR